jgi:hypothetical protein
LRALFAGLLRKKHATVLGLLRHLRPSDGGTGRASKIFLNQGPISAAGCKKVAPLSAPKRELLITACDFRTIRMDARVNLAGSSGGLRGSQDAIRASMIRLKICDLIPKTLARAPWSKA